MAEDTRSPSLGGMVLGLLVLVIVGWIVLSVVFRTVAVIIGYAGYVLVAVVAYFIGRAVGRSSGAT